jgi:putative transposase
VKFAFIASRNAEFDVVFMCRMLDVSRSGFYASQRGLSARKQRDHELVPLIHAEFNEQKARCGSRPIVRALAAKAHRVSRKRVSRLMAQERLRCRLKRRRPRPPEPKPDARFAKNILNRDFEPGLPNKRWAADITYIYTRRGYAYLAAILDLGSRKVVGWNVGPTMEEELVLRAVRDALETHRPPPGLIHHSDRGVQYAAAAYQQLLREHDVICSMSRKGNCWDNACVESFFSTLKRELPNELLFEDWRELESAVFAYVDAYYNTRRRHSALGYQTPNEYECSVAA